MQGHNIPISFQKWKALTENTTTLTKNTTNLTENTTKLTANNADVIENTLGVLHNTRKDSRIIIEGPMKIKWRERGDDQWKD